MLRFTLKLTSDLLWFHRRIYLFVLGVSYPGFSNTNSGGTNYSITDSVISFRKTTLEIQITKKQTTVSQIPEQEINSRNTNFVKKTLEIQIPAKQTPEIPILEK